MSKDGQESNESPEAGAGGAQDRYEPTAPQKRFMRTEKAAEVHPSSSDKTKIIGIPDQHDDAEGNS